jgi:Uma2 family endonuclease
MAFAIDKLTYQKSLSFDEFFA